MSENEVAILEKELKESQQKFCNERHGNINERLEKIENFQQKITLGLISIMAMTILNLLVLIVKR